MLHSFPRRQQRGRSMKSTRGFGFTVKWRNRLTTSLSVRILDWAGPEEMMTRTKDRDQGLKHRMWRFGREKTRQRVRAGKTSKCGYTVSFIVFLVTCSKLLNSHEREADECESFAQDFALVLGCGLQLLPVSLGLCPTHRSSKQTDLPHPESVPLQHCHQCI